MLADEWSLGAGALDGSTRINEEADLLRRERKHRERDRRATVGLAPLYAVRTCSCNVVVSHCGAVLVAYRPRGIEG